jgi:hypothetical protein
LTDLAEAEEGGSGDGTTVEFIIAFGVAAFESMVEGWSLPLARISPLSPVKRKKKDARLIKYSLD